uniref:Uncharacterized protein n=1 Tax=Anguilla anguilla TaxID=7936 RepID=A0A0E9VUA6_ANGAN
MAMVPLCSCQAVISLERSSAVKSRKPFFFSFCAQRRSSTSFW